MAIKTKQEANAYHAAEAEISSGSNFLIEISATGVGRYLQKFSPYSSSGVTKYLARKLLSSKGQDSEITSVKKYLVKQALFAKNTPVSSVSKYVTQQVIKTKNQPSTTGVSKYITQQLRIAIQNAPKSGVEKYLAGKDKELKKILAATLIAQYKSQEEEAAKTKADADALLVESSKQLVIPEHDGDSGSGVTKYLGNRQSKTVSGVAKYLANKILEEKEKPIKTGVTRYLTKQILTSRMSVNKTSVERYVGKLNFAGKNNSSYSTVSRYLTNKTLLGDGVLVSTGVSKYLAIKSIAAPILKLPSTEKPQIEKSLEGQLILANEPLKVTGVERYLDKQAAFSNKKAVPASNERILSGVDKYLHSNS